MNLCFKSIMLAWLLLLLCLPSCAFDFESDGLSYSILSHEEQICELTNIIRLPATIIEIPSTVVLNGKAYNVTSIADETFSECDELTCVRIPATVSHIGKNAFQRCSALNEFWLLNPEPPMCAEANCFAAENYANATLLVPQGCVDAYRNSPVWCRFAHIEELTSSGEGYTTGNNPKSENVYEMLGRKLSPPSKGINVVNGHRILIAD